jgi:hypothetical protein
VFQRRGEHLERALVGRVPALLDLGRVAAQQPERERQVAGGDGREVERATPADPTRASPWENPARTLVFTPRSAVS